MWNAFYVERCFFLNDFFFSLSYTYQIKDRAIAYSGVHRARKGFHAVHLRVPPLVLGIHAVPSFGDSARIRRLGTINKSVVEYNISKGF